MKISAGEDPTFTLPEDINEVVSCIDGMESLITGPALEDTATVLFILCKKVGVHGTGSQPLEVLQRVDDFLQLLGTECPFCVENGMLEQASRGIRYCTVAQRVIRMHRSSGSFV